MSDLLSGWQLVTVADVVMPVSKNDPKNDPDKVIRYIDISSIDNQTNKISSPQTLNLSEAPSRARQLVKAGDVLFSLVRPYLRKIAAVGQPYDGEVASTGFAVLRPATGIEPKYLFFKSISRDFVAALTEDQYGVSYPAVKEEQVTSRPFELPPLNEQRRIVDKIEQLFDLLDKGEESLQAARAKAGLYRQSLLKHAFEGHLTADWRAANPDKLEDPETLLTRIQEERDARYKKALDDWQDTLAKWRADGEEGKKPAKPKRPAWPKPWDFSDLSELPASWQYIPFEAIAYLIRNGISAKPDEVGPLKIFRISAVRAMAFDLSDFRRITDHTGEMEPYRLQHGDLVFTRYNGSRDYVGVSAMYRGDGSHVYPDKLIRCEIKSEILNPAFLEKVTNSGETRRFIEERIRTTAGQSGISGGDIKAMPVPICSPAEQAEIVSRLEAKLSTLDALEADIDTQLAKSSALRQSILKRAFEGKLVPQDPTDEPASALLKRIQADRAAAPKPKRKRKVKA